MTSVNSSGVRNLDSTENSLKIVSNPMRMKSLFLEKSLSKLNLAQNHDFYSSCTGHHWSWIGFSLIWHNLKS